MGDRSKYPAKPPQIICYAKLEGLYGGCGVLRRAPTKADGSSAADSPQKISFF